MTQTHTIGKHATTVKAAGVITYVRYHGTDVVRFGPGTIILDSGGYHTATTKQRMNQTSNQFNLGYSVFQKDFEWFVEFYNEIAPFYDGIVLYRHSGEIQDND